MKIDRIHHVAYRCKDAKETVLWYQKAGPRPGQAGSLLELTSGGKTPLALSTGEARGFLEDGDTMTLRGFCQRSGHRRIDFGECSGTVLPVQT